MRYVSIHSSIKHFRIYVDKNFILRLKFASRELFEKCDWRRSGYEATERMCNCTWSKSDPNRPVQCIGASLIVGLRRPNFVSRLNFFIRYRSRACGVKTGHVATGTAGFITNATTRHAQSVLESCVNSEFFAIELSAQLWKSPTAISIKVFYAIRHFFFFFFNNNFCKLNSWHIYLCTSRSRQLPFPDRAFRVSITAKYCTKRSILQNSRSRNFF